MDLTNQILNNRYLVQSLLAEGVLAAVYRASDTYLKKDVVVKVLKYNATFNTQEDLIRFKRQLVQVIALPHLHIVPVFERGEYQGLHFLVMELVEGFSLLELFQQNRRFTIQESVGLIYQITLGLECAHSQNLIHRDIRPSNIIIDKNTQAARILDFGLAEFIEYTQITNPRDIQSVFSYISPEQSGIMKHSPDERSDLYSLGIIFYQLLTGELPFKGDDVGSLLHQHMARLPLAPRRLNPEIPEVLEQMVLKLISKEPESRYQTAKGLLVDLEIFKSGNQSFIIAKHDRLKKILFRTRLIGREEELLKLRVSFEKVKSGSGQVCLVKGEAGKGKSRLVDEMRSYVYENKGAFISGKCFAQENKIPYQPFRDILNEYIDRLKKTDNLKREQTLVRLKSVLGQLGEIVLMINPLMEEVLGKQPPLVALDPEREHQRFLMVASRFFLNLGTKEEPFVFFIDDLQWSDEGSLSLLAEITVDIEDYPILIMGAYRDNEVSPQHSLYKFIQEAALKNYPLTEIPLSLFDHSRLNRLLAELLLEEEERIFELSEYILKKSKGNPFFSLEITRQLVEEKALIYGEEQKHWQIDWNKINRITIPSNIVDIVLRRIDTLEQDKLKLLSYAAVIGREFPINLLFPLTQFPVETVISLVDESIALQLLEKSLEKGKLLFVHDRIRDAFYYRIPSNELKKLHLEVAQTIEELNKDNIGSVLFDLAHHYSQGENKDKSLQYSLPAAHKAKQNYANEEAIKYYLLTISILESKGQKESPRWIEAKEGLTEVYLTVGRNDETIELSREILPLKGTPLEKARVYRRIGAAYSKKGAWQECEDNLAEGLALLGEKIPRTKTQVIFSTAKEFFTHILHSLFPKLFLYKKGRPVKPEYIEIIWFYLPLSWVYVLSNMQKWVRLILRVLNFAEANIARSTELAMGLGGYACLCMALPLFKRAIRYHQKAMDLRKEVKNEWGVAQSLQWMGYCYSWKGEYKKGIECFQESADIFKKIGDLWELGMVNNGLGYAYYFIGDYARQIDAFNEYLRISERIGDNYGISVSQTDISLALTEKGEFDEAESWGKKSLALSEEKKIWYPNCFANIHYGYLQIEKGNYIKAIEYLERAKQLYETNTFLKDYTVYLYSHLADAYISRLKTADLRGQVKRRELKKIKKTCQDALRQTKSWVNHYGGALRVTAKYYALIGDRRRAESFFFKAIQQTRSPGRKYELAISLYEYGLFLDSLGKKEPAKPHWQEAFNIFKEIGAQLYLNKTAKLLGITLEEEKEKEITPKERLTESRRLDTLIEVSQHLSSILNLDELLGRIVDSAIEVCGAERGFLILKSKGTLTFDMTIARGTESGTELTKDIDYKKYRLSRAIVSDVETKGESILFSPALSPQLAQDEDLRAHQIKSVICVPLKIHNEILGLLYLDNRLVEAAFDRQDLSLINSLAVQAGISLQNASFVREMLEKDIALKQKADELSGALKVVQTRAEQLSSISEICRAIALSLDINTVLQGLVTQVAHVLGAERISVMLLDEQNNLTIRASLGIPIEIVKGTSIKSGQFISGWVVGNQQPLLVDNIEDDKRFMPRDHETYYTKSLISCPLVVKNKSIGVVNINNKKDRQPFNAYELEMVKAICADIAVAVENARLYTELKQSYINTVESLALAVDAKDHYTQGHLRRVCEVALAIGKEMNLSPAQLENVRNAALLHDIGKIGISDSILLKPGKLSDEEWVIMKNHSQVSEKIVRPLGLPEAVYEIVRHHHERYDGKGYPDAKKGDEISVEAYILSLADSFDAMTSERPYHKAMAKEEVIEELKRCRSGQFHPVVTDAFLRLLYSQDWKAGVN